MGRDHIRPWFFFRELATQQGMNCAGEEVRENHSTDMGLGEDYPVLWIPESVGHMSRVRLLVNAAAA